MQMTGQCQQRQHHVTRLAIYDFDGTLVRTPHPHRPYLTYPSGKAAYRALTGQEYPFQGWWGREETLTPPLLQAHQVPQLANWEVVKALQEDMADPSALVILLSGRPERLKGHVQRILTLLNVYPHRDYYLGAPGIPQANTFLFKVTVIEQHLLQEHIQVLEIWEDRAEHVYGENEKILGLLKMGAQLKVRWPHLKHVIVHYVKNAETPESDAGTKIVTHEV